MLNGEKSSFPESQAGISLDTEPIRRDILRPLKDSFFSVKEGQLISVVLAKSAYTKVIRQSDDRKI